MATRRITGMLLGLALVAAQGSFAQVSIQARARAAMPDLPRSQSSLRVDTSMVLVPVSVCDTRNRPITGLEREHFRVFDDNVEQTVTQFAMDDDPVAVGLVFDISGSMSNKLRTARAAAAAFFKSANPEDEFFLVEFNDTPKLVAPLTREVEEVQNQLGFAQAHGRTALLDAIVLALHEMKKSHLPRRALLIISDGGDNASRYTERELKSLVRESDVLMYAIGIYGGASSTEEVAGPDLLSQIADQTGGRHFPAEIRELPDIAAKIGTELRNRYVLGYSPSNPRRDGRYHPVQVKLVPPRGLPALRPTWRRGYYAPEE